LQEALLLHLAADFLPRGPSSGSRERRGKLKTNRI
jgi:hypothetical protein